MPAYATYNEEPNRQRDQENTADMTCAYRVKTCRLQQQRQHTRRRIVRHHPVHTDEGSPTSIPLQACSLLHQHAGVREAVQKSSRGRSAQKGKAYAHMAAMSTRSSYGGSASRQNRARRRRVVVVRGAALRRVRARARMQKARVRVRAQRKKCVFERMLRPYRAYRVGW